jgi:TonB family protein
MPLTHALWVALTLAAAPSGPLTPDVIRDIVDAHRAQVKQCYASSPAGKKNLPGKIVVHFVISEQGTVSESSVKEASLADEAVKACLVSEVKSWVFPKPKHGPAAINFPFHFGPPTPAKPAPAEPEPPVE